jgi:hypothetical protein
LENNDVLNLKSTNQDIRVKRSVQENTENKISAICVAGNSQKSIWYCLFYLGFLLNMVDELNAFIIEANSEANSVKRNGLNFYNLRNPECILDEFLINNRYLIEVLNQKVVERKVESIANALIYSLVEEIDKFVIFAHFRTLQFQCHYRNLEAVRAIRISFRW